MYGMFIADIYAELSRTATLTGRSTVNLVVTYFNLWVRIIVLLGIDLGNRPSVAHVLVA